MRKTHLIAPLGAFFALACSSPEPASERAGEVDERYSSAEATLLDFELDAELVADASADPKKQIEQQLFYTIGHLNGDRAVGRLDGVTITNVKSSDAGDGRMRVSYHAALPVSWGSKTKLPSTYAFRLPRDVTDSGLRSFSSKYAAACIAFEALGSHEVNPGSMWYYYRPTRAGCVIDPADLVSFTATAKPSTLNTTGAYPEYQKIWEDGSLDIVAIFGKFEEGSMLSSDDGIAAYDAFLRAIRVELQNLDVVTTPAHLGDSPGASVPDVELAATLPGGRRVKVNALLVDDVSNAPASFYARYEGLSTRADVIAYNGHAGLGGNVRALAHEGKFVAGQYVIVFMNGCDTFAYADGALAATRALLNPDDPAGTKYMDEVTNSMPSFFSSMPHATMALIRGLLGNSTPRTYDEIFADVDPAQVVLVTGEEDNVFRPAPPRPHTDRSALSSRITDNIRMFLHP